MSYDAPVAPTLMDLLARRWALSGAVGAALFSRDGSVAAFSAPGTLALVPTADPERPESRIRIAADTARQTILPRAKPTRPAERAEGVTGPVAPFGARTFVTGSTKGGLVSVTARGQVTPLPLALDGPPEALAADPASSAVAVAAGGRVMVLREDAQPETLRFEPREAVHALAFSPDGRRLAASHVGGVTLWRIGGQSVTVAMEDAPEALGWSRDGAWLAIGQEGGFTLLSAEADDASPAPGFPTCVRSFAFCPAAGAVAASGAFRTAAWALGPDGLGEPVEAGKPGLVVVDRVAASPDRPLAAVGYASGLVCIAQIGGRGEMMLREAGGAVTALAWSADGTMLALGDAEGEAALFAFPPSLFK